MKIQDEIGSSVNWAGKSWVMDKEEANRAEHSGSVTASYTGCDIIFRIKEKYRV